MVLSIDTISRNYNQMDKCDIFDETVCLHFIEVLSSTIFVYFTKSKQKIPLYKTSDRWARFFVFWIYIFFLISSCFMRTLKENSVFFELYSLGYESIRILNICSHYTYFTMLSEVTVSDVSEKKCKWMHQENRYFKKKSKFGSVAEVA